MGTASSRMWCKLNTDGSANISNGRAGAGGAIPDDSGRWIEGSTNSLVAEFWALRDGLLLARELGMQSLIVELDARAVNDLFSDQHIDNLTLRPSILDCRKNQPVIHRLFRGSTCLEKQVRLVITLQNGREIQRALAAFCFLTRLLERH